MYKFYTFIFSILLLFTACSNSANTDTITYKFKPGTATPYTLIISQLQTFSADTRPQPQIMPLFMASQFNLVVPRNGSQATSGITLVPSYIIVEQNKERVKQAIANTTPILNEKIHFLLDAEGTIRNFSRQGEIKERHKAFLENLEQTIKELFPKFTNKKAKEGLSWQTQFVNSKATEGIGVLSLITKANYTIENITSKKIGKESAKFAVIRARYKYIFGNKNAQAFEADISNGTHIKIFGTGSASGRIKFNMSSGRVEYAKLNTTISTTTQITRGGKTNKLTQRVESIVVLTVGSEKSLDFPELPKTTNKQQQKK